MTARIFYSFAPNITVSHGAPFDADHQAIYRKGRPDQNPKGQLWDRVAESPAVSELGRELSKRGDL